MFIKNGDAQILNIFKDSEVDLSDDLTREEMELAKAKLGSSKASKTGNKNESTEKEVSEK